MVQLIASRYRERIIAKEKAGGGVGEGGTGIGGTGRSILRCAAATPPWCEGVVGGPDATSACACGEVIPELSDAFAAVECLAPLSCYAVFRCERGCVYATHVRCFEDWCLAGKALGGGGADWDEPRRILEAMSKSEPDARVPPEHVVDAVVAAACYFNSVNVSSNDSNSNAADAATKKATCLTPGCGGTLTSGERVEKGVAAKDLLVAPRELDAAERDRRERVGDALSASDGGENGGVSSPGGPPSSAIEPAPELNRPYAHKASNPPRNTNNGRQGARQRATKPTTTKNYLVCMMPHITALPDRSAENPRMHSVSGRHLRPRDKRGPQDVVHPR